LGLEIHWKKVHHLLNAFNAWTDMDYSAMAALLVLMSVVLNVQKKLKCVSVNYFFLKELNSVFRIQFDHR